MHTKAPNPSDFGYEDNRDGHSSEVPTDRTGYNRHKLKYREFNVNRKIIIFCFNCKSAQALEQVALRGWVVFILGETQHLMGHSLEQPAGAATALSRGCTG